MEMGAETLENLWKHTRCIDLLRGQHMIEIDSEASINEACEVKSEKERDSGLAHCYRHW